MPLPGTSGTDKHARREALQVTIMEASMPSTVAATTGAATLNQGAGFVTSETLSTAAAAFYTLTLTNSLIDANTLVFANASLGSGAGASTQGHPTVADVLPAAGSCTIAIKNADASAGFNGTIKVGFLLVRKAPAPL